MKYRELLRRCDIAMRIAIDDANEPFKDAIAGIIESIQSGPLKPGDVVDSSVYSRRVDSKFGSSAVVQSCWFNESISTYFVTVEDDFRNVSTAAAAWFKKL